MPTSPARRAAPGRAAEPAEQRRLDLLEAAYAVIAEKGLEGLRTRDVAARAGVNISTLHYYFATKDALLVALVDHVREKFRARPPARRGGAAGAPGVDASLRGHLESAFRTFRSTPHLSTVLQELVSRARRDAATRGAFRALHLEWNAMVEEVLRAGVCAGALRADLDPQAGARVATSFIMGAMMQLDLNPKAFDFEAVARELERWATGPAGPPGPGA
jgi:AcrR family transcriptional regulator